MAPQFPSFGRAATPEPEPTASPEPEPTPRDPRVRRSLLGGAAAIAVLGGGALCFVWLSTAPAGEAAAATAGVRTTPSTVPTSSPSAGVVVFDAGGRDIFAQTLTSTAAAGTATSTATSSSTSTSTTSDEEAWQAFLDGLADGLAAAEASSSATSASTATSTATSTPTSTATSAPVTTTATTPPVVPTPSVSTAPSWEQAHYTYLGTDAEDATAANFSVKGTPNGDYELRVAAGTTLYPAAITFRGDVDGTALITSDHGIAQGWLVPANTEVPAAAMGTSTGIVRVIGLSLDGSAWIQVNREEDVLVAEGAQVPGTPLTYEGFTDHLGLARTEVSFTAGGVTYSGAFGPGEDAGVVY
ncbi:hypothetical protein [Kineococcus glutinatus]|uniref:Uncharacterized protein n=1 Tax=Kineococcus glutinatus TaxID=1070872 RepID=A0ABP9HCN7_9ACTN